jgi:hypothetical protein
MKIGDYIYIFMYPKLPKYPCTNRLLVIGFLRKYFGFKLFYYFNL